MRVLVIEDEERLAANVARALREGAGYAVDIASDGQQGLYLAESGEYDLLVLDLMLPKLSGEELLQRYRERGGHSAYVLGSGAQVRARRPRVVGVGERERGRGKHDADSLRAFDHVRICHDVPVGIDDHAGTDRALASD